MWQASQLQCDALDLRTVADDQQAARKLSDSAAPRSHHGAGFGYGRARPWPTGLVRRPVLSEIVVREVDPFGKALRSAFVAVRRKPWSDVSTLAQPVTPITPAPRTTTFTAWYLKLIHVRPS